MLWFGMAGLMDRLIEQLLGKLIDHFSHFMDGIPRMRMDDLTDSSVD